MAYGIEFRRADGSVVLEADETFAGVIHTETVAQDFSGTFSVPAFDDAKGMFYVQFEVVNELLGFGGVALDFHTIGAALIPTLSWNNTTKEMTVTPASIPSNWERRTRPNFQVIFIHYR